MLVPEPFLRKITPEVLLAVDDDTPAISGAIAYRHGKGWTHLLRIRVIAPRQREGIGTELLRRLFLLAQEKGEHDCFNLCGHARVCYGRTVPA